MNSSRLVIALALSIICTSISVAQPDMALSARDPGVKRWIWYQVLGPRNSPFTIVYFSTEPFKTKLDESLVVLPRDRYDVISAYTHSRMARPDCPGKEPAGNVWYTVEMAEHDKNGTQRCVLPKVLACDYLSGVVRLSGITWTTSELRPINEFMAEIWCKSEAPRL